MSVAGVIVSGGLGVMSAAPLPGRLARGAEHAADCGGDAALCVEREQLGESFLHGLPNRPCGPMPRDAIGDLLADQVQT